MGRYVITILAVWIALQHAAVAQDVPDERWLAGSTFDRLFVPATALESVVLTQAPQPSQEPPTPPSTGFRTLARETAADFVAFPQRPSTWVILGSGAIAAALGHLADDYVNGHLAGNDVWDAIFAPGKWIGSAWVQGGTAVGLYLVGRYVLPPVKDVPKANKVSHLGMDLLRAQLLSQALVHSIKYAVRRDRPTGECCSFPSGHAASAFATASVLERHFGGYRGAWPTLVGASYVAASRLHDNRHFLSDVIFGSAIGVATGWTVVGRHGRSEFALLPEPIPGGMVLVVVKSSGMIASTSSSEERGRRETLGARQ
jgi:membrane-associated phospholipid phosphatase